MFSDEFVNTVEIKTKITAGRETRGRMPKKICPAHRCVNCCLAPCRHPQCQERRDLPWGSGKYVLAHILKGVEPKEEAPGKQLL
jgi:hypothetical protein